VKVRPTTESRLTIDKQTVVYKIVHSKQASKLRLRVGPHGVEVISPKEKSHSEVEQFVARHETWIVSQLKRVESLRGIRRSQHHDMGQILFRGIPTTVIIEMNAGENARSRVIQNEACLVIKTATQPLMAPVRTLENWLRREARREIERQLNLVTARLNKRPRKVYIMGQRTKWGNCSRLQNLSFNWRLIMAPEHVLRYLVTHEAVHLAVPDHSRKFWLTVLSLCPETERAKQWLSATGQRIQIDLNKVIGSSLVKKTA
jgi:predicted metal-dependent hydrolase